MLEPSSALLKQSFNEGIAFVADALESDAEHRWSFCCECGRNECSEWVELELATYREIRAHPDSRVLASGHIRRAGLARAAAVQLRSEAEALRAQALHQRRRAWRLRRDTRDPDS